MKNISFILLGILLIHSNNSMAQVGINNSSPQSTLDITVSSQSNPSNSSGVIIPRVNSLNTTDTKEKGLLVFLNSSGFADRGFYWWDGVQWNPFLSNSKITGNKSITYVSTKSTFKEGNMTQLASTNNRTIDFESIKTNDSGNFEINSSGELIVKKAGYYHVQAASFILKNTSTNRRDQLDMKIFVNGNNASNSNSENFNLEGSKSYPTGISTIAINVAGLVKLDVNDRIAMKIVRSYRDTDPNDPVSIIPDPNTKSNLTLRYLGNF